MWKYTPELMKELKGVASGEQYSGIGKGRLLVVLFDFLKTVSLYYFYKNKKDN